MAFTPQQHREYREKLKAEGICTRCHKEETESGRSVCAACYNDSKEAIYKHRREGFRCHDCMNPLDEFSRTLGRARCQYCMEKENLRKRRQREKERC